MRLSAATGAAAVSLASLGSLQAQAFLLVKCGQTVGTASVDPIVNHNDPMPSMHEHQFFGNNSWLGQGNSANYADLLAGATNCREAADTAGYWTPTLRYKDGREIKARAFSAYYRGYTGKGNTGPGVPYPADVRLVGTRFNWTCGQKNSQGPVGYIPDCSKAGGGAGDTLTAHIDFPSCWDGTQPSHSPNEMGDTRDNAHWAYVNGSTCPAGFPIKTTELRETIQFYYTGKGDDVDVSSDAMAGTTGGRSLHGDFWNAWQQSNFSTLIQKCVNTYTGGNALCEK